MTPLAVVVASALCLATPVQHASDGSPFVQAGPFTGYLTPGDAVAGRFSLHAGAYRAPGMSQKIPWFPTSNAPIGATLVISGESLSLPHRSFSQSFSVAHALDGSQRMMFPSILAPPAPGCWLFTLSSGQATATIAVRVRARVKSPS